MRPLATLALLALPICSSAGTPDENARAALAVAFAFPAAKQTSCPCGVNCPLGGSCGAGCPCPAHKGPSVAERARRAADGWAWSDEEGGYWWRYKQAPASAVQIYRPSPVFTSAPYFAPPLTPTPSFAPAFSGWGGFSFGGGMSCGRGG